MRVEQRFNQIVCCDNILCFKQIGIFSLENIIELKRQEIFQASRMKGLDVRLNERDDLDLNVFFHILFFAP